VGYAELLGNDWHRNWYAKATQVFFSQDLIMLFKKLPIRYN